MTHPTATRRDGRQVCLLNAALAAAEQGWHVFPLRPGAKRPALHGETSCPRTGACADGHQKWEWRATTDPERIRAAWFAGPFNVGIATGPSNLVVVDLDVPKDKSSADAPDGAASLKALCERAGQVVPATYRVRTPSGGHHLYFHVHPGIRLGNTAGTLAPLVDTRAWGGYVVAPGSIVNGAPYEVIDDRPPLELPTWLMLQIQGPLKPAAEFRAAVHHDVTRVAQVALERETATVAAAAKPGRNTALLRAVRAVGRFVAWGDLPRHVVEEAFQGAGEAAGLPPSECRATIRSALDWSIRTCRPRAAA